MSRVLKGRYQGSVIPAPVYNAAVQACALLDDAKQRAQELVDSTAAAREEARARGFEQGRQEGLAQASDILVRARVEQQTRVDNAEKDLRRLAVSIAEKILSRELAQNADAIVDVVKAALVGVRARRELVLRVHPKDLPIVQQRETELGQALLRPGVLTVRGDEAVAPGGCMIDTEVGTIDARLSFQLAAIERARVGET